MYDVSKWMEPPERWPREMNKKGKPKKENLFLFSKYVLETVERFLASKDEERDMDLHVPMCSSPDIRSPVEKYQQAVSGRSGCRGSGLGTPLLDVFMSLFGNQPFFGVYCICSKVYCAKDRVLECIEGRGMIE